MRLVDYLCLLDWTGRQVRHDKQGNIPEHLAPILDRLKIVPQRWSELVQQFGRWFSTAAGNSEALAREAKRRSANGCKACGTAARLLPEQLRLSPPSLHLSISGRTYLHSRDRSLQAAVIWLWLLVRVIHC